MNAFNILPEVTPPLNNETIVPIEPILPTPPCDIPIIQPIPSSLILPTPPSDIELLHQNLQQVVTTNQKNAIKNMEQKHDHKRNKPTIYMVSVSIPPIDRVGTDFPR